MHYKKITKTNLNWNENIAFWFSFGFFEGGPLTVTDANLALGRLLPSFFPKIFGPGEDEPLSLEETMKHFHNMTEEINVFLASNQSQVPALYSDSFIVMLKII